MSAPAVNIRVGRLTMTGPQFNRREASQFRAAFERELARLLRDGPLRPAGDAAYQHLAAPLLPARTSPRPAPLGAQAARNLYEALGAAASGHAR